MRYGDLAMYQLFTIQEPVDPTKKTTSIYTADGKVVTTFASLTLAALAGNRKMVEVLLPSFMGIQHLLERSSAFCWAARYGWLDIAKNLITLGVKMTHTLHHFGPPLVMAAKGGSTLMIKLLILHGAQINGHGSDGNTALMIAVKRQNLKQVKYLLTKGASTSIKNAKGQNAVMIAIKKRSKPLLSMLTNWLL